MIVSAKERREVLRLFNVSEAARLIGVDIHQLHRDVKTEVVRRPTVKIKRRMYYQEKDLTNLSNHYGKE